MQPSARSLLLAVLVLAALVPAASAKRLPGAPRCPVFPRDNAWNQRVDHLGVAPDSARIVASIGLDRGMHADFGSGRYQGRPIGIPFDVVSRRTHRSRVRFDYADESNRVRYPIPRGVHIEGGAGADGDRHALLVDRDACKLYELYELYALKRAGGRWTAGAGAAWSLRSNQLRPRGWTSADAAGLPILPGLARYDEVRRGRIDHALRFTVSQTRNAFVFPARHFASSLSSPALPRMGERLRLRQDFDASRLPRQARVVARALKEYGMLVADNGSDWYLSGAPNRGWNNDALHQLGTITGADFDVVRTG